jgi:hypothetical protein
MRNVDILNKNCQYSLRIEVAMRFQDYKRRLLKFKRIYRVHNLTYRSRCFLISSRFKKQHAAYVNKINHPKPSGNQPICTTWFNIQ